MSESLQNSDQPLLLFIAEAKRRHVFRAAGLYAGAAFIALQVADILMPALDIADSAIFYLLVAIAVGFPLVLAAAWVLDISGGGVRITPEISLDEKRNLKPGRLIDYLIVVIALGVGYLYLERFLMAPQISTEAVTDSAQEEEVTPQALEPSIAVLPFENLSGSKENEYFAAGIHEDILNNLSQISGLIVTSRTSTLGYGESVKPIPVIAEELNVNYVIEGSVRRAGDRVRISVQLIQAAKDKHIWSEGYERDVIDIFEIQRDVANQVSHALKVQFDLGQIAGEHQTKSLRAYEMFLQARDLDNTVDPDAVEEATRLYRETLEIDPQYSDAWAGLALALRKAELFGKADQELEEATIAADKALMLTPDSWLANYAKAEILSTQSIADYAQASAYYQRAIEINPNDGNMLADYGFNLWFEGRAGQAREQFLAAYRRDPLSAVANLARAMAAVFGREEASARKFINRALEIDPDGTYVNWWAGNIYSMMNDFENSSRRYAKVLTSAPDHLGAMLWVVTNMTTLDNYVTAEYWLDKIEAIAPNNSVYMWRRANSYSGQNLPEEYIAHVNRWLELEPDNMQALRYRGYATARQMRKAWEEEDDQLFREANQRGLEQTLHFLKKDGSEQGDLIVRFDNSWSFIYAANYAKTMGEDQLAEQLYHQVIDYYQGQPEGAMPWKHMQLAMAKAGLGLRDEAVNHARRSSETDYRASWLFRAYNMDNDVYGIYAGIDKDIAFQDVLAKMARRNEETIERIREQSPGLFPPIDVVD